MTTTTTQPTGQNTGTPFVNNWYGQPIPGAYQVPVNGPINGPINGQVTTPVAGQVAGQFNGQYGYTTQPTAGFVSPINSPINTPFQTPFNPQFTSPIWNQFQSPVNTWTNGTSYTTPFNTLVNSPLNTQFISGQPIGFGSFQTQSPVQTLPQSPVQGYTPSVFDFFPSTVFNRQPIGNWNTGLNTPYFNNSILNTTPTWNTGLNTFQSGIVNGLNTPINGFNQFPINQYPVNQYPVNQFPVSNLWNSFQSPLNTFPTTGFNPQGFNGLSPFGQLTGNTFGQLPQWTNSFNGFVPSVWNNTLNTPYLGQFGNTLTNSLGNPFVGSPINQFPIVNTTPWQTQSPFFSPVNTLNQFGTPFFGQPVGNIWSQPIGMYQTWSPVGYQNQSQQGVNHDLAQTNGLNINRDAA